MNHIILAKVIGGHLVVLVGMSISHLFQTKDSLVSARSKPVPVRVVAARPPPPPPKVEPPKPTPRKPKVEPPKPTVVKKDPPKPKPKPKPKKPAPKKVVKKPTPKPRAVPTPAPVPTPQPPSVPVVEKPPSPEDLFRELQALAPKPIPAATPLPFPQPQARPYAASQQNLLQRRVEQECLAGSWARHKPNRILNQLNAIAVARILKHGEVRFAGFKLPSGDSRMDEAVRLTIERAGCRFPLPINAPDFVDLEIEFQLN